VHINRSNLRETDVSSKHVEFLYENRKTEMEKELLDITNDTKLADQGYTQQRMRHIFRRTREEGFINSCMLIISVPLTFIRDYSVPMGEMEAWDRRRASIVPVTTVISFFYLAGNLQKPTDGESIFKNTDM
jgi:hypothetical protein